MILFGNECRRKVRNTRFPRSLFWLFLLACCLVSGAHQGIMELMDLFSFGDISQTHITMVFWILIATVLTLYTKQKIEQTYDIPMQKISEATKRVANGDFSVYIPPVNPADRRDYLDIMIMDLNQMIEELGSIETLKTDFVSNVSHEMKTPIAVIKNAARLIRLEHTTEEQKMEYLRTIDLAANRLSELITNILRLNRLENQKIFPETTDYDVCRQLCDCVIQFENCWEEKYLELELETDEAAFVQANQELMELVWNNLISNAIKFTEPGGRIHIRQTKEQDAVVVSVSDNGCGMTDETIRHIYDKFYQGDTSHAKEGNGLGMALVYRVLQLCGGRIDVDSVPGKGSTFTVRILEGRQPEKEQKIERRKTETRTI